MLGLVMGRVGTMPASANPNSQQPAEICDDNRGNPLNCLILLEQQNSEKLIAMQEVLNRQETSLTTINSNVTDLTSVSTQSAEATLEALSQQSTSLTTINSNLTDLASASAGSAEVILQSLSQHDENSVKLTYDLQEGLDRLSKIMATLSSMHEKLDEIAKAILENLCDGDDC